MWSYPCPSCESGYAFHTEDCELDGFEMWEIERAYVDIIARLTSREQPWEYDELRGDIRELGEQDDEPIFESIDNDPNNIDHPGWTPLHDECLHHLKNVGRAVETDAGIEVSDPEEQQEGVVPQNDPMRTVYEYGPIDGCKDYAVYSMVSWCELIDLDWSQTKAFVVHWLNESGRWDSEDWGERSPVELVKSKQHIHDKGLGWGDYPEMAKAEMESSSHEPRLEAREMAAELNRELLSMMSV